MGLTVTPLRPRYGPSLCRQGMKRDRVGAHGRFQERFVREHPKRPGEDTIAARIKVAAPSLWRGTAPAQLPVSPTPDRSDPDHRAFSGATFLSC